MAKVEFTDTGHWLWTGSVDPDGYGRITRGGTAWPAHRWAWWLVRDDLDPDLPLDHLCRERRCVNPDHLEPVTTVENSRRAPNWTGNREHCPQGHPYDETNTVRRSGRRECRICKNAAERDRRARRRAERSSSRQDKNQCS